LAGSTQSVGWGSINETSATRNLEDRYQYDFAANIELGKLFPEKAGVHLPVYYNYSNQISNPEYNPLSSDIKMNDALSSIDSPEEKDMLKNIAQEVRTRESFTVNNVTIEPERKNSDRKPLPTDIENFSVSYSYAQEFSHDVDVEKEIDRRYKASFDYNYSISSKYIEPFKKAKFLDNDFLRIIKDFNVSFLPELISFRTDMQKDYFQRQARDNSGLTYKCPLQCRKISFGTANLIFVGTLPGTLKSISRTGILTGLTKWMVLKTAIFTLNYTMKSGRNYGLNYKVLAVLSIMITASTCNILSLSISCLCSILLRCAVHIRGITPGLLVLLSTKLFILKIWEILPQMG
jgi:cell surface protein SprA